MFSRFSSTALILGLVFSALIPTCYAAKIYHWVDDKGQPHYSENAPREIKSETMNVKATGTGSAGASDTAPKSQPAAKPKAIKSNEKESASAEQSPEDKAKYCQQSRDLLQQMNGNTQRRFEQPDGSFQKLEQTEIADYQSQAREGIKNYCK
jgi:hypothetical protein